MGKPSPVATGHWRLFPGVRAIGHRVALKLLGHSVPRYAVASRRGPHAVMEAAPKVSGRDAGFLGGVGGDGGGEITVDSKTVGSIKLHDTVETPLEPRRHTLQIRAGRYSTRSRSLEVADHPRRDHTPAASKSRRRLSDLRWMSRAAGTPGRPGSAGRRSASPQVINGHRQ